MQVTRGACPVFLGRVAQQAQVGRGDGLVDQDCLATVEHVVVVGVEPQRAVGGQADDPHKLQGFAAAGVGVVGGAGVGVGEDKVCGAEAVGAVFVDGLGKIADGGDVVVVAQVERESVALCGVGLAAAVVGGDLDAQAAKVGRRVATEGAGACVKAQPVGQGAAIGQAGAVGEVVGARVGVGEGAVGKGVAEAAGTVPGFVRNDFGHHRLVVVVAVGNAEVARAGQLTVGGREADVERAGARRRVAREAEVVGVEAEPGWQRGAVGQGGSHGQLIAIGVDQGLVATE